MGGGHSGLTPEQKHAKKVFDKIKNVAGEIAYGYYETMIAFDENGDELFRNTDNEHSSVGFGTQQNWLKAQNNTAVHNHPEGSCFSPEDLEVAKGLKEIWAVTSDRIMTFSWKTNVYSPSYQDNSFKYRTQMDNFIFKLREAYNNGTFTTEARREYDKKYPLDYTVSQKEFDKALKRRERGIKELAQEKQRKFFKNHADEYGFKFSEKKWTRAKVDQATLDLLNGR